MKGDNGQAHFLERVITGARVFFVWAVFLFVLEVITWFGTKEEASRTLDTFALFVTVVLILSTTVGVRVLVKWQTKRERHDWA